MAKPEIILAKSAGFCFGVERAVNRVYEETAKGGDIYTYGPIIHNKEVVADLEARGVRVVESTGEIRALEKGTVIIRSHGVSREIDRLIRESGLRYIDATCPFVKRIHRTVEAESAAGKKIVIVGNPVHPEVIGIMGWSSTPVTVIQTAEEAKALAAVLQEEAGATEGTLQEKTGAPEEMPQEEAGESVENRELDGSAKMSMKETRTGSGTAPLEVCVVAQTTFNANKFQDLVDILRKTDYNVLCVNTICNATHERQSEAKAIAAKADIMIVIGDRSSSNSAKLYEICSRECRETHFIQTWNDLHLTLTGAEKVIGITAGASTPKNIIEEVYNHVRADL